MLLSEPVRRQELLWQAWRDVGKVFLVAIALDLIYELVVYRWVYPTQAILVAVVLAIVPYLLARGPAAGIAHRLRNRRRIDRSR